jgi:polar amino acid transport system ATP-binding protein
MSARTVLAADGVMKRWPNGRVALESVSFSVDEREVVAVVGANGCGKSTLLSVLAGLESVDAGRVQFRGTPITVPNRAVRLSRYDQRALSAHRARVGLVFQQFHLFPHLSVGENCMIGPRYGLQKAPEVAKRLARAALERVGMHEAFDRRITELSGGQQQRVAIARALANEPEILLLDEPTSALDPQRTREIVALLRALTAECATAMVIVSHDLALVREIADRVVLLNAGRVAATLPTEQFLASDEPLIQAFLSQV